MKLIIIALTGEKAHEMNSPEADTIHLETVLRHISNVQSACRLLANRLISKGDFGLAKILIYHSLAHDSSKLMGLEWDCLRMDDATGNLSLAQYEHISTNAHHPEYWGGIEEMPLVYLAEAVCDWYARSAEAGTDLRSWIKTEGSKKYKFSLTGRVYKRIKRFVDLLLDPKMGVIK